MLALQYPKLWQFASFAALAAVLAGTLVPSGWLWPSDPQSVFSVSDKWLHAIAFAILTLWFSGQYARSAYWRIVVGLLAFGVFIELCQRALTYRSAELADVLANTAGIAAGLVIAFAGAGGWSVNFERWLHERLG